jgi:hypothetical protein
LRAVLSASARSVCDKDAVVGVSTNFDYSDGQEQEQRGDQGYLEQGLA